MGDVLLNMSRPTEIEIQEHEAEYGWISSAVGGLIIAFFCYIAILSVTFAVKTKTKAVGITIIILGVIGVATTNLYGIIPFGLILPAGIIALRHKVITQSTS